MIPVRGFETKRVAVFGLGRTGLTAARALKAGGAEVIAWDEAPAAREAAAPSAPRRAGNLLCMGLFLENPTPQLRNPRPTEPPEPRRHVRSRRGARLEAHNSSVAVTGT